MNVVHRCPPNGTIFTPCCERTVFELDALDRMTVDPELVTCERKVPDERDA